MRVLVATDLTAAGDETIRQAAMLAGTTDALAAVHVVPFLQPVSALFPQTHAQEALDESQVTIRLMDAVRARIARVVGRDAQAFVEQGTHDAEILRRAESWKADVVVVGSRGQSGSGGALGSVAERIVRGAHCSVLVARAEVPHGGILVAIDLSKRSLPVVVAAAEQARRRHVALTVAHAVDIWESRDSSLQDLVAAVGVARQSEAAPTVAHVLDLTQVEAFFLAGLAAPTDNAPSSHCAAALDRLTSMLRAAGETADPKILEGPAAEAIVGEARRGGADLVVVGSHGSTSLGRLLVGSVAEEIARSAPCSVLVVRPGI
jgi:nucleotide-binding universal stress UspA family protein